jgi:uncharacterized protein DUF4199
MEELQNEEYEQVTVKQVAIKWGLISGIASIVFFMIINYADLVGNSSVSWLGMIPFIIILILAHSEFKNQGDGFMSYGQGLGIGTFIALVSAALSGAFTYVYTKFIFPDYNQQLMDKMVGMWEEQGMTEDQIDAAMGMMSKFQNPELAFFLGILVGVFMGFIFSLIIAAITKKNNPDLSI